MFDERFDVIVIGAGHAGCEAASASARMGAETALVTLNLDLIGQMSCNPAIGGIAKGHVVREIDALGGIMGRVIDRTGIQFRLLNRSRGPAVQSPRAQADRSLYRTEMRRVLEATPNLTLKQGAVVSLIVENKEVIGVELEDTRRFGAKAVVIATGTFLNGTIHTGRRTFSAGRSGEPASIELAENLKELGFPVGRLKTGTPPRLDGRTIDWDAFERQAPDEKPVAFSFATEKIEQPQIDCYIGYTTNAVHDAIRGNLSQSPLYSGKIKGIGPRYCPSIEDKVVKFAGKDRHQLFLEPEGHNTNEVYLNGFSTSLPAGLQQELLRMIEGFGEVRIIRPGYAIEYDFVDPRELRPTMETTRFDGLFLAGQINGTTGYEEAAAQGLVAGLNAALRAQGRSAAHFSRSESYIGVMIDDLVTRGVSEPYRMFTSRAEFRLSLRADNADQRLTPLGIELGCVGEPRRSVFAEKMQRYRAVRTQAEEVTFSPSHLRRLGISVRQDGQKRSLFALLGQADITPDRVIALDQALAEAPAPILRQVATDALYHQYVDRQARDAMMLRKEEGVTIPEDFDYDGIAGLSNELKAKLTTNRPTTLAAASRLEGMTPAALTLLLSLLKNKVPRRA